MNQEIIVYRDLPWYYAELLSWRVENGIIKAFPKKLLSDTAHKTVLAAFRRWGGKYVSWNGQRYFELVLDLPTSTSTQTAADVKRAYEELKKEPSS